MKYIILAVFIAIIISLASGLFFLAKYERNSTRLLTALKFRITLSVLLIAFLVVGYYLGWLAPGM